ncbi:MAG: 50S ribosomal protein L15 [Nitrospirae bacterium]|nr:MAG: 50S ribosomal protein L15 [Nitrospirota bacterium]
MRIEQLRPTPGSKHRQKRVGRGPGSGHGKTSCRGHKGQKARSGGGVAPGFEGGQMPLYRRLPKRGFNNKLFAKEYTIVNLEKIAKIEDIDEITPEVLLERKIISKIGKDGLKVLGKGQLQRPVTIKAHAFSEGAVNKIKEAGGKAEVL